MAEIRNLQLDGEDLKYETKLGPIYHIELVKTNLVATVIAGREFFISCGTCRGYLIDLSLRDMGKLSEWWEINKKAALNEKGEEDEAHDAQGA